MRFGAVKVDKTPILVKTYKDGSKRWRSNACPRCGGTGFVPYNMDAGRCWKCGGSGYHPYEWTEDSEERTEKKKEKNKIKLMAQADGHNANFLKWNGFNEDGKAYVVLGDTYKIKDELKAMGGKFDYIIGWKLPQDTDKYPTAEIDINEIVNVDENGWWSFKNRSELDDYITKIKEANKPVQNEDDLVSDYVGNIGDRITVDVTIKRISSFDTNFSYYGETMWVYRFEDNANNIYIWKTSGGLDKEVNGHVSPMQEGDTCTIAGTIKEHKEYKGEKETILTRVKKLS